MTLERLEQNLIDNKPANLEDLSNNLVFGEGNPNAQLMIIGEAPGEDEDLSGRPFVGRAGQLLDKILESVDIKREDIYVTNIVKYRPPGNRNPNINELKISEPVLIQQIEIIKPQLIATLGNIPTQFLLNTKEGITKIHGNFVDWRSGIKLIPIYHPAYLLRNPSREKGKPKWQTWQDMKKLKQTLDDLGPKTGQVVIDNSEQDGLF